MALCPLIIYRKNWKYTSDGDKKGLCFVFYEVAKCAITSIPSTSILEDFPKAIEF